MATVFASWNVMYGVVKQSNDDDDEVPNSSDDDGGWCDAVIWWWRDCWYDRDTIAIMMTNDDEVLLTISEADNDASMPVFLNTVIHRTHAIRTFGGWY